MPNTPNMNLPIDTPSVTPGPGWAQDLETMKQTLDTHTHVTGQGLQVPTAGLNVNADLPIGSNNITGIRAARFNSQSATLAAASDLTQLYAVSGNMYWNNSLGQAVQITIGSGIASSSIGGITGLAGTQAALTYSSSLSTFVFTSGTTLSAALDSGAITLRQTNLANAKGITLQSPNNLGNNYNVTFPPAVASGQSLLSMDTSGNVTLGNSAPMIQNLTISGIAAVSGVQLGGFPSTGLTAPPGASAIIYQAPNSGMISVLRSGGAAGYPVSMYSSAGVMPAAIATATNTAIAGGHKDSSINPNVPFFIPANTLRIGSVIRVSFSGTCTSSAANQVSVALAVGSTGTASDPSSGIALVAAATTGTNIWFSCVVTFTFKTVGASPTAYISAVTTNAGTTGFSTTATSVTGNTSGASMSGNTTNDNFITAVINTAASTTSVTLAQATIELL